MEHVCLFMLYTKDKCTYTCMYMCIDCFFFVEFIAIIHSPSVINC